MTDTKKGSGSCLCEAIKFTAQQMKNTLGACHCNTCRKWGGSAFMGVDCGPEVTFQGEENLVVFNSSDWAERGFCALCGSHLFYRLKGSRDHRMPVGLFDDDRGLVFDHQLFIDEKPDYYTFSNKTEELTGAELFAKFSAPEE